MRTTAGSVHVWRADLAALGDRSEQLLDEEELARAARIVSTPGRTLWARSRGFLRELLGRYAERDPRELRFVLGAHGKPALATQDEALAIDPRAPGADLRFNLSHSGELALVAVCIGREVGVDVEVGDGRVDEAGVDVKATGGRIDELAVAARVLGQAQAERLAALDPRSRRREFMRAWVAHEAAVKCRGLGLFTQPADSAPLGDLARRGYSAQTDLWTADVDVGRPDTYAAVAVEGGPCELHIRDWCA